MKIKTATFIKGPYISTGRLDLDHWFTVSELKVTFLCTFSQTLC